MQKKPSGAAKTMSEELSLVTELAIILIAAGIFTVISKALKQPLILGYIVAGFLVGPHLGLFPQFSTESVHQWSEIGIIFMLFSLGLEFSFKKLLQIGSSAFITAGTICVGMFLTGTLVGTAMRWTMMESIFLGGLLSMSSTTIILKAYDDLGLKNKPYASLIFGSLVFEDLIAVLMMVLLSTMAVSNQFAGGEMLMALGKLGFFLVLWFLVGIYVIPSLLKRFRRFLSDEILLLVSIGLCFGMVVIANAVGFSSALGAFVMGSILAETVEGEHIHQVTTGIKDLFGAIFFVSVGMMVDPAVIAAHWPTVLVITLVAMTGILLFATGGALLAGKGLDTAVHTGFTMAQLGEFGFIIASVGCSLGVMRDFIYPVIIAVSVITAFTTPYMIKAADPALALLRRKLPPKVLARIDTPQEDAGKRSRAEQSEWKRLLKSYFLRVGLYSVLLTAILIGSRLYLNRWAGSLLANWSPFARNLTVTLITLAVMAPFLYGLAVTNGSIRKPAQKLLKEKPANRWPILTLTLLRVFIGIAFVLLAIVDHFDLAGWTMLLIVLANFAFFWIAKSSVHRFGGLEERFFANFNEKEEQLRRKNPVRSKVSETMAGYDVHLETITISPDYAHIGKPLRELPFRHASGINILKIARGSQSILIPAGDERIFPGDRLLAVGTTAQIDAFLANIREETRTHEAENEEFAIERILLTPESPLAGKTLREADLRRSGCMVISYLRDGVLVTNPKADDPLLPGDSVWLAGEKSSVDWYR